jgi:hypothetical protein
MFTLDNYESASQQRPTSSYFIYNDNANQIKSFPTGAMNSIKVVSINQDIYGNKVLPNTFVLTSSAYRITDDGFGNLYNYGTTHIGNIFYAHGLAIITNQSSQSIFPDPPFALPINLIYTQNAISSEFDYFSFVKARDFELDGDTLILSGSSYFVNQDTNLIGFTGTLPGVYETYYKVASRNLGCGNVYSNLAKITVTITKITDCNFTATTTSTTIGCDFTLSVSSVAPPPTAPTPSPTTAAPTTSPTASPTTAAPTNAPTPPPTFSPTAAPTTAAPTTSAPTTAAPTTAAPTTAAPTTAAPTTAAPTTAAPTAAPTTAAPTTAAPTTAAPTAAPTTAAPTTAAPTTAAPTTAAPTAAPTTAAPTTAAPTTAAPTTAAPTAAPTTAAPTTAAPTTAAPTAAPTTAAPTTAAPTAAPTTAAPTTAAPTTAAPTTAAPTTAAPTTAAPTTPAPTNLPSTVYIHLEEWNESPTAFLDANLTVNAIPYYFSGDFSASVPAGTTSNVTLEAAEGTPSNVWGSYTTASALLSIYETGVLIYSSSNTYYSGSGNQNFSHPVTYGTNKSYVISGSTVPKNSCYNTSLTTYTVAECYFYPNEYESNQILTVYLDSPAATDVRVSGSLTDGSNFDTIISAGFSSIELYNSTCGCTNTCLSGNGFSYISVTTNSGSVSLSECSGGGGGAEGFRELFPTGSLFITAMSYNCATPQIRFNFTGGLSPYSASISIDTNGDPIWSYTNITTTPFDATSIPLGQIYYPAIKDAAGVIVNGSPIYDCATLDLTFKINPLSNTATGDIYYPALPVLGSQNRGNSYRVTGSKDTLISVSAAATNGSTFKGWSYTSGSLASIFTTDSTIQLPLTNTGSIIYALIEKNVISSSFCYYNADPIGTVACDACAVTSTIYMNGNLITGSTNYTNVNWYSNESLATLVPAGYYKFNTEESSPIYQVSAGPTQTKTLIGFCNDDTLTC